MMPSLKTETRVLPLFTSDALPSLTGLGRNTPLRSICPPSLRIVIDANAAVGELYWTAKTRRNSKARSELREAIDSGIIVPYAPPHLEDEVRDQFERLQKDHGVSGETLEEAWSSLRQVIHWVEPRAVLRSTTRVRAVRERDVDDEAYAALALQIGAAAICTSDRHFRSTTFVTMSPPEVGGLKAHARAAATELGVTIAGGAILAVGIGVVAKSTKTFLSLPSRAQIVLAILGIGCALYLGKRGLRSFPLTRELRDNLTALAGRALDEAARAHAYRAANPTHGFLNGRPRSLADLAVVTCAESSNAVSLERLASAAVAAGYRGGTSRLQSRLRSLLARDGRFVNEQPDCWRLVTS